MPLEAGSKLILAFVTLIIGVLLLSSVATEEQSKTALSSVGAESFNLVNARVGGNNINESNTNSNHTVANAPSGWKTADSTCNVISNVVYRNASTNFVEDTDYTVDTSNGIVHVINTTDTVNSPNETFVEYDYCADGYLTSSWQRTVLDVMLGLFAIGILLVSVGLFFSIGKDHGLY